MNRRQEEFCFYLAKYLCYPNSLEIGGCSEQFLNIIKTMTKGYISIRDRVFEYCTDLVLEDHYNTNIYKGSYREVLNMMKEDYNKVFFN